MAVELTAVVGSRCKATAQYIPVHDDEIALKFGDLVQVLYLYDDGWVLGKNKTSGEIGLLPGNFLTAISDKKEQNFGPTNVKKYAERRHSSLIKNVGSLGAIISSPGAAFKSPEIMSPNVINVNAKNKNSQIRSSLGEDSEGSGNMLEEYNSGTVNKRNITSNTLNTETLKSKNEMVLDESHMRLGDPKFGLLVGIRPPVPIQSINPAHREAALKKYKEHVESHKLTHVFDSIGTIRAIVAGDSGIGRTSFIYTFLSSSKIIEKTAPTNIEIDAKSDGLAKLMEIRASTNASKRQHEAIERFNLSFIEPVGLGVCSDTSRIITLVMDFHLWQFQTTDRVFVRDRSIPKSTLIRFLNSGTGAHSHIDACIYGVLHRLKVTDIQFIKSIAPYTVIIPVILKSDTLTPSEVFGLKLSILQEFRNAGISTYGFGFSYEDLVEFARNGVSGAVPFAVYSSPEARNITVNSLIQETPDLSKQKIERTGAARYMCLPNQESPQSTSKADIAQQQHDISSSYLNSRSEKINEIDVLRDSLLTYYINDIRRITAEKFVKWRSSILDSQQN